MTAGTIVTSYQLGIVLQHNTAWGGFSPFHVGVTDADRARHADLYSLIKLIPQEASVSASETIVAQISSRKNAYSLRIAFNDADYLLVRLPSGGEDRVTPHQRAQVGPLRDAGPKGGVRALPEGAQGRHRRPVPTPVRCLTRLPVSYYFPMSATAQPQPYGRGHRALEIASIAFVFLALGCLAFRICHAVAGAREVIYVVATGRHRIPGGGLPVGLRPLGR